MKIYSHNPYAQRNYWLQSQEHKPCPVCNSMQVQLVSYSSPAIYRCRENGCRTRFEYEPEGSPYEKDWSPDDFEIVGDELVRRSKAAAGASEVCDLPAPSGREQDANSEAWREES